MKYAFLVAWREYAENAKTKGFWMGIFVMPLILFLSIQAPIWLEQKATPIRYFVLVDQSRSLGQTIESRLESLHQRQVLEALNQYARKYARPGEAGGLLSEFADSNPRAVAAFMGKAENATTWRSFNRIYSRAHHPSRSRAGLFKEWHCRSGSARKPR